MMTDIKIWVQVFVLVLLLVVRQAAAVSLWDCLVVSSIVPSTLAYWLATVNKAGEAHIYQPVNGTLKLRQSLNEAKYKLDGVDFAPKAKFMATVGIEGKVRVYQLDKGIWSYFQTLTGPSNNPRGVAFDPNGESLATVGDSDKMNIFRLQEGSWTFAQQLKTSPITNYQHGVIFTPNEQLLTFGESSNQTCVIRFYDSSNGDWKQTKTIDIRLLSDFQVYGVASSPDGLWVVIAGSTNYIYKLINGNWINLQEIQSGGQTVMVHADFHPNSQWMALVGVKGENGSATLFKLSDGVWINANLNNLTELQENALWSVGFSPDGQLIAIAGESGIIYLYQLFNNVWNLQDKILVKARNALYALAFSPAVPEKDGMEITTQVTEITTQAINTLKEAIEIGALAGAPRASAIASIVLGVACVLVVSVTIY